VGVATASPWLLVLLVPLLLLLIQLVPMDVSVIGQAAPSVPLALGVLGANSRIAQPVGDLR
jgi:hypothetical protein